MRRLKEAHLLELRAAGRASGTEEALRDLSSEFHHSVGTIEVQQAKTVKRGGDGGGGGASFLCGVTRR